MKRLIAALLALSLSLAAVPSAEAGHRRAGKARQSPVAGKVVHVGGAVVHVAGSAVTLPLRLVKKLCHRG